MLSRSDSERQRNLMIHDQRPLPVYFSQVNGRSNFSIPRQECICTKCRKRILGDEFHFLFECNGIEKLRISSIPKYYRTRCSTLKMSQLLNTNDRKLLIKVAKFVYFGMKEYTSLPDVVSEEIDNVDLNCLYD